ncbi:TIGR03943 family putative permease subunit [Pseudarthrobacter sp. IC2-21]|uniref:TIGR03943 family putative permease subunit n=1 Tax=Pseudarthrobacter sp. IC2-21 TaxID=3092262 RepID=UPI002A6A2DF3|nr:TIGR03943 family protein [Pseudarthrobacter sp. IC2-21]
MLSLIGTAATLWLALTGKLELYIHPRYVPFTVSMALLAAAVSIAGFIMRQERSEDPGHPDAGVPVPGRLRAAGSLLMVTAAVLGLLILPPSPLTAEAANHRDLNRSGTLSRHQTSDLLRNDPGTFTLRDWASLLRYSPDASYFADKKPTVTGFITADPQDPTNVFYVTRFVVSCCTVDAQPVGVPVRAPGWQTQFKTGNWVAATGGFGPNPNPESTNPILLTDAQITPTTEPERPYLH